MTRPPIISVIGSLNIDYLACVEQLPGPGQTVSAVCLVQRFGGKGANQAIASARFGARVNMIGCVGADDAGRAYLRRLKKEGVRIAGITTTPRALTGTALIAVDRAGENNIIVASGANALLVPAHIRKGFNQIAASEFVLLQLETPLVSVCAAIRLANQLNVPVALNPSPLRDDFPWGQYALDTIIVNAGEAEALFGLPVERLSSNLSAWRRALARQRVSRLVITRGAHSSLWLTKTDFLQSAAFRVKPVDTVGAGDAFAGVLVACLAEGIEASRALAIANCAGALTTLKAGAQESMPGRGAINHFLRRSRREKALGHTESHKM